MLRETLSLYIYIIYTHTLLLFIVYNRYTPMSYLQNNYRFYRSREARQQRRANIDEAAHLKSVLHSQCPQYVPTATYSGTYCGNLR